MARRHLPHGSLQVVVAAAARRYAQRNCWRTTWHTGQPGRTRDCVQLYAQRLLAHPSITPPWALRGAQRLLAFA